jgi:uncharacterized membrane protein
MSDQAATSQRGFLGRLLPWVIMMVVVFAIIGASIGPNGFEYIAQTFARGHLHAPDLALIARAPLVLQLHLLTVLFGFAIGTIQMIAPKGTVPHRVLGWTFAVFMLFTAIDALFIKDGPTWRITPIQIFSVIVLVTLPLAISSARRHKVDAHARSMTGLYFGGLILAGIIAFMPGRLMWRMFFG